MLDCKESSLAGIPETDSSSGLLCCRPDSGRAAILQKMMDLSLFKDPIFMMYATSNFLTSIGFNVPYVFTVVSYFQTDVSNKINYLTIISIASIIC